MPPSMHILMHGSIVIQYALLPIGQLSKKRKEESRNKDYSNFRENNTRKMSRISTNTELMHALLISSDPVIFSERKILKSPTTELTTEVKNILIINYEETEEDSQISIENSESDSE
uniref:Uncharacterized protein n=1 Tax=Sipha flava TaxID=143950 RepID=A0A2S2QNV1_9HEMI